MKYLLILLFLIPLISAEMNTTLICSSAYDFIMGVYGSGNINYSTQDLADLTSEINAKMGSDLSSDTIVAYIDNYPNKCKDYKELPASYLVKIFEGYTEVPERNFWSKYRYEFIFLSVIVIGIFGMRYFKRNKNDKKKLNTFNRVNVY